MQDKYVLLVDPEGRDVGPNVALAYIRASLESKGIDARTLDFNNCAGDEEAKDRTLIAQLQECKPLWIGYSILYTNVKWACRQIRKIRPLYAGKIVVGGPQAILQSEELLKESPEIDALCLGEGERFACELTERLAAGAGLGELPGILFRDDFGSIVKGPASDLIDNLDALPFPDFGSYSFGERCYPILTSRGCPYNCSFCFRAFRHDWRKRSPENVVAELKQAMETRHITCFTIHDDTFNMIPERVMKLCSLLLASHLGLRWSCAGIRADRVSLEMARNMKEAGCESVAVGVETLDEEVFASIGKNESLAEITDGIRILKEGGLKVTAYMIIGLPGDTYRKCMESFRRIRSLGLDGMSYAILLPLPGTRLCSELQKNPAVRWLNDYRDIDMVWLPRMKKMDVSFETTDFPAKDRLKAYRRIRAMLNDPCSSGRTFFAYHLGMTLEMLRFAPWKAPSFWASRLRFYWGYVRTGVVRDRVRSRAKTLSLRTR